MSSLSSGTEASLARTSFGDLVGRSSAMRSVFTSCAQHAASDTTLMLVGESGSGKHALARAIHAESARRTGPFVVFDASGTTVGELASELFGRAEGETRGRAGALELAHGGTLLLAELADLPASLQARLHAALVAGSFVREQGGRQQRLDVRIVTTSRRRLAMEVERERLHAALYTHLAGVELCLPALRERRDDVPLLVQTLLARLPESAGNVLSPEALLVLSQHDWPGNVRELRNLVERFAYALHSGQPAARRLSAMLLSGELSGRSQVNDRRGGTRAALDDEPGFEPDASYRDERARFEAAFEQRYVTWLLDRHDGNVSAAARAADMDRKYLHKLAKKHGLKASD